MELSNCIAFALVPILTLISGTIQSAIHPAVTLCKRNDPNVNDCYCTNFAKMIPILKDGAPGMQIPPIDPIKMESVKMDLRNSEFLHLMASLSNVSGYGLSGTTVPYCRISLDDSGLVNNLTLQASRLSVDANYVAMGYFATFALNAAGDVHAEFSGVSTNITWTGVKRKKGNEEYLEFKANYEGFKVENVTIKFNKIFPNNTGMDAAVNAVIEDNIQFLTNEVQPIAVALIESISSSIVNNFYGTYPYNVLFPIA